MSEVIIRAAIEADVPEMTAIYNTYIVDSHVSFATEPWTEMDRLAWFQERTAGGYPLIVACDGDRIIGTAWSGPYRPKKAYRSSVETTVVLAHGESGRGIGSALLTDLTDRLSAGGFHRAIAIIALPNDASIVVHEKVGYRIVGTLDESGFKDGVFYSTMLMQKALD